MINNVQDSLHRILFVKQSQATNKHGNFYWEDDQGRLYTVSKMLRVEMGHTIKIFLTSVSLSTGIYNLYQILQALFITYSYIYNSRFYILHIYFSLLDSNF